VFQFSKTKIKSEDVKFCGISSLQELFVYATQVFVDTYHVKESNVKLCHFVYGVQDTYDGAVDDKIHQLLKFVI
jgi:hypothetical protein